jgi:anaerobic magnesium-protoporphyrin IX monomethyl ester cyclase
LRLAFDRIPNSADTRSRSMRWIQKAFSFPARWRLDHDIYEFPVEVWLNEKLKRKTAMAKPAVDAKRLEPATSGAAC